MKRARLIKTFAIIFLCLIFTFTTLIGCSKVEETEKSSNVSDKKDTVTDTASSDSGNKDKWPKDPNLNAPGVLPICKETVKLTIGIPDKVNVEDWETNLMTLELEKRGNFDLEFIEYPEKEFVQKIELMMMAGGTDLPDVIMHGLGNLANVTRFGQAGMIIPVNDYYEHLAYHTNQSLKNIDLDCFKYITSYDGNIYGLFNIMVSLNNEYSGARIMIYEPWLQKLGLEMPQTTEEFLNVLRAFKNNDPNQNGKNDEFPMLGYKDVMTSNYAKAMMTPFVYTQDNYWTLENGKIGVAFTTEGWREGLRYTKQLIDEGLLSPLSFTQDRAQFTAMVSTDPATVGVFPMVSTSFLGAQDAKRAEYIIVPPLEGPTGRREQVWSPSLPRIEMVITKNCKTPEAAFMLGDLMCNEEFSVWQRWGREGIDWKVPAEGAKSVYDSLGYKAIIEPIAPWGVLQNIWWYQTGPYIVDARWPVGQVADPNNPYDHNIAIGRTIGPQIQYANRNPIVGLVYNEQEQEIITELHSTILSYVRESFVRFATGDLDLNSDWDKYLAEFDKMGLDKVIEVAQSAYDRMNKK